MAIKLKGLTPGECEAALLAHFNLAPEPETEAAQDDD
jgi:hypothetical protein